MDLVTVTSHRAARGREDLALAPGETLLAGGTWLFSEPQPEVSGLVDLTTLGWPDWESLPGVLRIGATCTVSRVLDAPWGPAAGLVRPCADSFLMSWKVQHVATVGGNLCLALPAGAMISLTAALDATVVIWTPDGGERREPVVDFVTGAGTTTLAPGEVLRAIDVPTAALCRLPTTPSAAASPHPARPGLGRRHRLRRTRHRHRLDHPPGRARRRRPGRRARRDRLLVRRPARPRRLARARHRRAGTRGARGAGVVRTPGSGEPATVFACRAAPNGCLLTAARSTAARSPA